jgi:hypothetical protein
MGFGRVIRELNRSNNVCKEEVIGVDESIDVNENGAMQAEPSARVTGMRRSASHNKKVMKRDTSMDNFMKFQWSWVL